MQVGTLPLMLEGRITADTLHNNRPPFDEFIILPTKKKNEMKTNRTGTLWLMLGDSEANVENGCTASTMSKPLFSSWGSVATTRYRAEQCRLVLSSRPRVKRRKKCQPYEKDRIKVLKLYTCAFDVTDVGRMKTAQMYKMPNNLGSLK